MKLKINKIFDVLEIKSIITTFESHGLIHNYDYYSRIIIDSRTSDLSLEKNFWRRSIIFKMSRQVESQTEGTGVYDPLVKINSLIQNCCAEKTCFQEKVGCKVLNNYKVLTPLFWAEQPKNRKYKAGKFCQTPRNFYLQDKFTQTVESDFVNKKSKIINFSGRVSIQKRKREIKEVVADNFTRTEKRICVAPKIPPTLCKVPEFPVPKIVDYKPTPIIQLEKLKIQKEINKVEAELQKLEFDSVMNKIVLGELRKETQVIDNNIERMKNLAEYFSGKVIEGLCQHLRGWTSIQK